MTTGQAYYATLDQAKSELKEGSSTTDDNYILAALRHVASRIDLTKGYPFAPRIEERFFDARGSHIDSVDRTLRLDQPLLVPQTVIDGDDTTLTLWDGTSGNRETADYYPYRYRKWPYFYLRRFPTSGRNSASGWNFYVDDWVDIISVTGIWGYHRRYDEAWLSSGDTVQDNPLVSSATSITVADADGADGLNRTPRFSPGNLVRIESEFIEVVAVNTTTNVLTVIRGVRGSAAASHVQTTVIDVWQPDEPVQRACLKWVGFLYSRRSQHQKVTFDGIKTISFPPDAPDEVEAILAQYPNVPFRIPGYV